MTNNFDLNNFNSFLDKATKAISCGPDCQKNKTAKDLKNKYLRSKSNLTLAEPQYQAAKQNYYKYVSGEDGYNEMMENEYKQQAKLYIQEFKTKYNEEVGKINTQINTLNGITINYSNVVDLYNQYKKENTTLSKQLKDETNDILTNDRKTYYQDQQITSLNSFYYYILLVIYVIVVICFIIFSLIYPSQFSFINRLLLIAFFVIIPFISTWILGKIIFIIYWLFSLLPKNVYK